MPLPLPTMPNLVAKEDEYVRRRYASNNVRPHKVLLELRPRPTKGCRCKHESGLPCRLDCTKNQQRDCPPAPQMHADVVASPQSIQYNGPRSGTGYNMTSNDAASGFPTGNGICSCRPPKKSKAPPPKILLELWDRDSRPKNNQQTSADLSQYEHDRPAYARRFMQGRRESETSVLSPPLDDNRTTPTFDANPDVREQPQFVLPPLPLGLRPPSPEPRNVLLNAPKKPRFSSPRFTGGAFDMSSLTDMLEPWEMTNNPELSRPVCRQLKFTD
ncbi:hypothetical protein KIN20_025616 [Parelaphostrongylus tenuis]|uniref:Uncharacterized protein n=1 Tax=Parelaphostrongylus tenuis TaxID=148309 RepID=A0AAD5NC04_PARTN|nr:hypothetical protein KIN20_025616 [Parelaphostrongylus tenuis]